VTDAAEAATHLRAQTSAVFPGARGQAYRIEDVAFVRADPQVSIFT
jgi:hypothetical protein